MWKKLSSMLLVLALFSLFTINPAQAGGKQRYMWYGAGIALGSIALLRLVTYPHVAPPPPPIIVYSPPPQPYYPYYPSAPLSPPPDCAPGHWETTREWVPGAWERVWISGHYDRWRNWVPGHYEDRPTPGYYVERRGWVERDSLDY
jgi:hypothetical protein